MSCFLLEGCIIMVRRKAKTIEAEDRKLLLKAGAFMISMINRRMDNLLLLFVLPFSLLLKCLLLLELDGIKGR